MSFSKEIKAISLSLKNQTEQVVRGTLLDLTGLIIKETPADTGRLRGNWQASINAPLSNKLNTMDKNGNAAVAAAGNVINNLVIGNTFYLTNNLPYAAVVEYGGYPNPPKNPTGKTINGYSRLAPQGMVRKNVALAQRLIEQKLK